MAPTSAAVKARLYNRTSSIAPFHPNAGAAKYRPMYRGRLVIVGAVNVSLPTSAVSTYSLAVAPSNVAVTRCHPLVTAPPSAHPYPAPQEPVVPLPPLTTHLYPVPVALVPK